MHKWLVTLSIVMILGFSLRVANRPDLAETSFADGVAAVVSAITFSSPSHADGTKQ